MRRNNGWLAILAISMVLPILRHGLAGEQLPLDYGNTELRANGSKAAYDARGSNRPLENHEETEAFESSTRNAISDRGFDSRPIPSEIAERTTPKKSKLRPEDSRERADKSKERIAGTEILDTVRESRDSSWFFGAAIKNRSGKDDSEVHRRQEEKSHGTSTGNRLVNFAYRYYGHVDDDASRDREKLDDQKAVGEKSLEQAFSDAKQDASSREIKGFVVPANEVPEESIAPNEIFDEKQAAKRDIVGPSRSISRSMYNLMNNERSARKSIDISGPKDKKDMKNSADTDRPYFPFDFKLNRTEGDSSNFEDLQLAFNNLVVASENETLSKQVNDQVYGDNGNFSMDPDFPDAGHPSIMEMSGNILDHPSNQSHVDQRENISRAVNETNDHEENDKGQKLHYGIENESSISSDVSYNSFHTDSNLMYQEDSRFDNETSDHVQPNFTKVEKEGLSVDALHSDSSNSYTDSKQEITHEDNEMEMNFSITGSGSLISSGDIPYPDSSNQNRVDSSQEKLLHQEINGSFDNETYHEKDNMEMNSTFIMESGSLISSGYIPYSGSSNQSSDQKILSTFDNETNDRGGNISIPKNGSTISSIDTLRPDISNDDRDKTNFSVHREIGKNLDLDESNMQLNFTFATKSGGLISSDYIPYPNSSTEDHTYSDYNHAHSNEDHAHSNQDRARSCHEETPEELGRDLEDAANDTRGLDFTFDEGNVLGNSINQEEATANAAELNGGEPVTGALMLDNEVESNNEDENETDARELNATWSQLNEHGKEAKFKAAQEEGSVFKGVTKEAEVFVVSPVESLVESSAYLTSKKIESTVDESNNDPSRNLFTASANIWSQSPRTSTERSGSKISSSDSGGTANATSESLRTSQEIHLDRSRSLAGFSGSSVEDNSVNLKNDEENATRFNGSLNGSIIASIDGSGVSGVSPNQNTVDGIKNNEPAVGFRWKNAANKAVGDGSEDNGTLNQVNPTRKEVEDIEDERSMDPRVSGGIMGSWINERFPKGRKSRSSRVSSTTSAGIRFDSTKVDETAAATSIPIDVGDRNVSEIESTLRVLKNDPKTSMASLDPPTAYENRSIAWNHTQNLIDVIDHSVEAYVGENVTFPTTEFGLQFVDVDPSITAVTGNEQRSFGFDVNSIETNGEEHANAEDGLYKVNNSSVEMEPLNQWPVKHSAVVEGDLVLGGLMMVHEREDTITCGPVMPQGGVQALEAMLYTLDRLNDRQIVPGVRIGAHILDDCDKDTYGLEMAVDFIKGSISNIDGAEYHCNKTAVRKVISGVVGAASSVTSIQVANLLRLFRIPQVSFFSTSPELSNKQRFEYFTRTIPSDHYQVKAMIDIVLKMGWSYVSIIYEESNYGIKAFEELEELLGKHDICIAIKEKLVKDSGVAEETAYDNIVLKLLTKPRARGCIIFGSDQEVAGVMRAVRRCNATGAFSWIGSDGWSARGLVSNGNEPEVEGTLSVQPQANPVKGFEEYFLNLTVENNRRNPWFVEFWEDHFQCRYPNASRTPYNQKYTKPCTTKERLTKQNTAFEDQLQFVSDAVMAFAYAFRDMHRDLCHGRSGLCDAMKPTKGTELLKYLRKVDFEGLSGDKFKFDKNGDGPARYNIIHFKQIEPGKYKWIRVGKYLEGELRLNMSEIQFKLGHPQPPESVCSLPCEVGQAKKYVEGERCCWHCFNCTQYQIRHPKDETQCIPCRQGTVPDETHSTCRDIPEEFLRPESGWAIGAMSFSAVGIMITLFVCGVFLKHNDTPVVRASGRELSYVLLSGILLCYLVTFALVLRPTDIVCGIQRFAAGFCFTVVYAALLTKTNRISRIFNASKHSAKRPSFISPRSQLIICSGLVFVQILINGVWMIIDPARAMHHYPTREDNLLVCNSYVDASYMIAFAYPIMLIVVCTVYAVLTRKIPEAFNESKHIGFTMYTTCVIWLAFVPLYFGTGNNVALRITSMSVTISLSASVTIACLFSPKLYIILIRPERNVRQSMMPARYSTTKSSAVTATNASSMIAPITLTAATCDQNKAVKKHIITTIDCSTQSEYYELEVKDRKNGKPPPTVVSRSTQTSGNNEKDSNAIVSSKDSNENTATTKQLNNNARIGNGPVNQSDVPL